jgi:hypothetical protein
MTGSIICSKRYKSTKKFHETRSTNKSGSQSELDHNPSLKVEREERGWRKVVAEEVFDDERNM